MAFETYQGQVYVQNGNNRVAHTVMVQADSVYSAQQQLAGMYGHSNVIGMPMKTTSGASGSSNYNPSPWM